MILDGGSLDSGGTTYESQESTNTTTSTTSTSTGTSSTTEWEDSIENKAAAVIDVQTSGSGNVDEQLAGGTTADQVIGDATTNPDVTQELAEMTATGDATNPVPGQPQNALAGVVPSMPSLSPLGWAVVGIGLLAGVAGLGGD